MSCSGTGGGDDDTDTVAPTITTRIPASGATGVALGAAVHAVFSEDMDAFTINGTTFTLSTGGAPIAASVAYAQNTAVLTPSASLAPSRTYTAHMTTAAQDAAGNQLATDDIWSFTTATSSTSLNLTSTALAQGGTFMTIHNCAGADGDVNPPLAWTAGPPATQSYAIVFSDLTFPLIHWALWDISAATTSIPQAVANVANPTVPAGSKQAKSYDNVTFGYKGPCPPATHTYEFVVYALDVATLPGVTTASTRTAVETAILQHDVASGRLSGNSD